MKITLYAIRDKNSKLYKTISNKLEEVGSNTHLFDTRKAAEARLRYTALDFGMSYCGTINDIVWSLIEDKYGINRWHVDISYKEFEEVKNSLDLEVVEVSLNYKGKRASK